MNKLGRPIDLAEVKHLTRMRRRIVKSLDYCGKIYWMKITGFIVEEANEKKPATLIIIRNNKQALVDFNHLFIRFQETKPTVEIFGPINIDTFDEFLDFYIQAGPFKELTWSMEKDLIYVTYKKLGFA